MIIISCIGFALFVFLFFHPFITYPLSLLILRSVARKPIGGDSPVRGRYGVVFCAYNERAILTQKLDNLLELQKKHGTDRIQILAYSDGSNDGTDELLANRLRSEDGNVASVGNPRRGKSAGMNELVSRTDREFVVFTDANVLLADNVFEAFDQAFSDPKVGVACGHLIYVNDSTATANVGTKYWQLEEVIKQLETETGSAMGADGSIFAIRRELFSPVPEGIIDDFCTSMRILCRGYRIVRVEGAVAYERSTDKIQDENKRKVRIACRALNCHNLLKPDRRNLSWLDKYKYLSHKWIRWHAGFWILFAWICGLGASIGLSVWFAAGYVGLSVAGIAVGYVAHYLNVPILSRVWVALCGIYYTALGTVQARMGKKYQTWTPANSARLPTG